jgi:hypothetical protein
MLLVVLTSLMGRAQTKPTVISEMVVDYVPPPATLDDAVQRSAAIVVGRVRSAGTYRPPIDGAALRMVYSVQVTEVLRNSPELTTPELNVYRLGGDIDNGDHVKTIVERGFPRFTVGHQYLMFLSWNRVLNGFEVGLGPNGIYELMPNGTVETAGGSMFAQSQKVKSGAALIADIKRIASIH